MEIYTVNDRNPVDWDRVLRELLVVSPTATPQEVVGLIRAEKRHEPILGMGEVDDKSWWICRLTVDGVWCSYNRDEKNGEEYQIGCPTISIALLEALKTARGK